jgi:hypothetical protein
MLKLLFRIRGVTARLGRVANIEQADRAPGYIFGRELF